MLDRIEVAVFDVPRVIGVVTNQMFPEAPLPDAAFIARLADSRAPLVLRQGFGEARLDQPPTRGKIRVVSRQTPNCMEMVGKHDDGRDLERMRLPCLLKCVPQSIGMLDEQLSVVEGAFDSELRCRRRRIVESDAPSTIVRATC